MSLGICPVCGEEEAICPACGLCFDSCCDCAPGDELFDADELGLDPEEDDDRRYPHGGTDA